jgi:integrase
MSDSHHIKLTQLTVERLQPPPVGRVIYWDLFLPGFGVRVSAPLENGRIAKSYVAMYRVGGGKQVMETLGPLNLILKVEDARELARTSMLKARDGVNPVAERRQRVKAALAPPPIKNPTRLLRNVIDKFMEEFRVGKGRNGEPRRPGSIQRVEYCLKPLPMYQPTKIVGDAVTFDGSPWNLRYIDEITRDHVKVYLKKIGDAGHEIQSNRSLQAMKAMFKWAKEEGLISVNPIAELSPLYAEVIRNRWLSDPEIAAFWWACDQIGYPHGRNYQLLLLTACRRNEVAFMPCRGELNFSQRLWTIPAPRTKTNQAHLVYLTDLMLDIFERMPKFSDGKFVFVGAGGKAGTAFHMKKKEIDALMLGKLREQGHLGEKDELERWTFHDLRRTARTGFSRLKVPLDVKKKLLNHKLGGMDGVYDMWEFFDEKKEALERWSDLIKSII